jgi:hypothetical protein
MMNLFHASKRYGDIVMTILKTEETILPLSFRKKTLDPRNICMLPVSPEFL